MREILIRDLSRCINCGTCVAACASRHGRPRMAMGGPRFGQYQLPDVCRHCPDTPCVRACPFGAMVRHNGRTYVSNACRGCSKCVKTCRYGVIALLPRAGAERRGLLQNLFGQDKNHQATPPAYRIAADAARCVQCGICVQNCPAGIDVRKEACEGHTVQDPRCFGCGLCVAKCPRGTLRFETYPAAPVPRFRADKCDLCHNYSESNCIKECPTGALMRVPVSQALEQVNEGLYAFLVNLPPEEHTGEPAAMGEGETITLTPVRRPTYAVLDLLETER